MPDPQISRERIVATEKVIRPHIRRTPMIEAAGAELGPSTPRLGFYSYGEIAPHPKSGTCELHNQTMTVTAFAEVA